MDLDPDDVFRDDEDDENELLQERESTKEYVVYLVDASPKMFSTSTSAEDQKNESHFHIVVSCIAQSLKTQIINRSYDEVAVCFFNTREKKNMQDLNGVFVYNVAERDSLDRPTARFIKEFDRIEESFVKEIGSQYGIVSGSRENSIYNALWVAQGLLRKGSAKTADKRILLFTNEDDPFGSIKGAAKTDMTRTTLQRAKDAQDLGISIELLPLSRPGEEFNVSLFYSGLIGLEGDDLALFMPSVGQKDIDILHLVVLVVFSCPRLPAVDLSNVILKLQKPWAQGCSTSLNYHMNIRGFETPGTSNYGTLLLLLVHKAICFSRVESELTFALSKEMGFSVFTFQISLTSGLGLEDMKDQLRKRMFTKRIVKRISFIIANGLSIELNSYALIRPTVPGATTWLDSVTNRPLKTERSFICADTGALMQEPPKRFQSYKK
ncbi:hypothetical protein Pint_04799 [Pistacia integerrima]|uniref:Uncharacterized protein n=1 Tax=Pistacia integerrima TaxID=434235 RepID=A0ACC0Z195_9ROSI|nr:hypothetical protein Pint_04799 [Pistacia integerrima]